MAGIVRVQIARCLGALLSATVFGSFASCAAAADNIGSCVPGAEIWSPPANLSGSDVPAPEALRRLVEQSDYLEERYAEQRSYMTEKLAEILKKNGLTDEEQAILLGGANWLYSVQVQPYAAANMADDFYNKNLRPLLRSAQRLRGLNAPKSVKAIDLDYMDDRFARLNAFEGTLERLMGVGLALDGERAVVLVNVMADEKDYEELVELFAVTTVQGLFGGAGGAIPEPSPDALAYREELDRLEGIVSAAASQSSMLLAKINELTESYRAMQTQFTVELGQRSAAPDCQVGPEAQVVPFPEDAVAD